MMGPGEYGDYHELSERYEKTWEVRVLALITSDHEAKGFLPLSGSSLLRWH